MRYAAFFLITVALLLIALAVYMLPSVQNVIVGSETYSGVVLDASTGTPVEGAEVLGSYSLYTQLAPTLDGLYTSKDYKVEAVTDFAGEFRIRLRGHARSLSFYNGLKRQYIHPDLLPRGTPIIFKLKVKPRQKEREPTPEELEAELAENVKEVFAKEIAVLEVKEPKTPKETALLKEMKKTYHEDYGEKWQYDEEALKQLKREMIEAEK